MAQHCCACHATEALYLWHGRLWCLWCLPLSELGLAEKVEVLRERSRENQRRFTERRESGDERQRGGE